MFQTYRRFILALVALLAALAPGAPSASGGRPAGLEARPAASAAQSFAVLPAPGALWRFATAPLPLITAPAVGRDGTIYVGAGDGVLYAITPQGRRRWSVATGVTTAQSPPVKPAIGPDGASYWNVQGSVVAVAPDGRVRWVFLARGNGPPLLWRNLVLFAAGPYLYAIYASGPHAGQRAWRAAIGAGGTSTQQPAPALGPDGTAYVASPDGYLYAVAPNGQRRWAFRAGVPLAFSPAVGFDGTVYLDAFANGGGTLYALALSGRRRWRVAVPAGSNVVRGPGGTVYVAAHYLVAISPRGRVLWRSVVDATAPPLPLSASVVIVPMLAPPALLALDARGRLLWRLPLRASPVGSPVAGPRGRLYSGDYAGTLAAFAPQARGAERLIQGAALASPAVDLGARNPPFVARSGAVSWRVTLARTVERATGDGHWRIVFTPGVSTPDQRTGQYHNARYAAITFLAVDPRSPRELYVGTLGVLGDYLSGGQGGADGGLFVSPNGASGWQRLDTGLSFTYEPRLRVPTYGLDSLVFDPMRRGVLYAQTLADYGSPGHDAGLYKSTDGGRHWQLAVRGLTLIDESNALLGAFHASPPGALLIDRARSSVLFFVNSTGFYRSADAAARWSRVSGVSYNDPASIAVRIAGGGTVRAYSDRGSYLSTDFGVHWRRVP